jgi:hypothetical protein
VTPLTISPIPYAEHAWRHVCGTLNLGRWVLGDPCEGCWADVDPADVHQYGLVTLTGTVLSPPTPMTSPERMRLRAAAFRATHVLPGPVGEAISRELLAWEEFGVRFGSRRTIEMLVLDIEKRKVPKPEAKQETEAAS